MRQGKVGDSHRRRSDKYRSHSAERNICGGLALRESLRSVQTGRLTVKPH